MSDEFVNACLRSALHTYVGAADRWAERIQTGLTNDQLKEAIGYEFGIWGGGTVDLDKRWSQYHSGGVNPSFKAQDERNDIEIEIKGAKLVSAVRVLLNIPPPGQMMLPIKDKTG
jgi:hypothetical protein